jgi:DNA-binding beta-propeller fold protein YncE
MFIKAPMILFLMAVVLIARQLVAQTRDLPTSKQLIEPVPGAPQKINSLPMSMAISPDKRYVVTINAGFGTAESNYDQSLAVLDTQTGQITDFPDARTLIRMKQTLYSGLAFSHDGTHIYASIGSLTDPQGTGKDDTGSGIIVYGFAAGKVTPERIIRLPLEKLALGHITRLIGEKDGDQGVPFPAAIEVIGTAGAEKLLVAENYSDDVLLLDAASGAIEHRFDLAESYAVPSTYPGALALSQDGHRAFVAL